MEDRHFNPLPASVMHTGIYLPAPLPDHHWQSALVTFILHGWMVALHPLEPSAVETSGLQYHKMEAKPSPQTSVSTPIKTCITHFPRLPSGQEAGFILPGKHKPRERGKCSSTTTFQTTRVKPLRLH